MFIRTKSLTVLTFLILTSFSVGQYKRVLDYPPISNNQINYKNIYSGGFNNIEHQFIDIDNDGNKDLFFLNSDNTFGLLKNIGNAQNPDFTLSLDTIAGLSYSDWFYFVDADSDGDFDCFSGNGNFFQYRENIGSPEVLLFILEMDTVKDNSGEPIPSEFGSNPVFTDIDGDGDVDFISGNTAGTVTFYENIGNSQAFSFKFITNFWQNIQIIGGLDNYENRHGASSYEFADLDGDGDLDMLWGDFFSNSLYLLENQGSTTQPQLQLVSNVYPINGDSVNTSGFNMPRTVDIDADGDLDLFVSVLYDPSVPQSLIYYKNNGNQLIADFQKITDDYLQTLDAGNNSYPVLADVDADGDLDLFIGCLKNPNGSIYYFENTGTADNPNFDLVAENFFNISYELSVVPAFGDIDGDEDLDLLVGRFDGKIALYKNNGNKFVPDFSFSGLLTDNLSVQIDIGTAAAPLLFDVDEDNDLDLIIGGFNGRFSFYRNIGSANTYQFQLNPGYFNGLDVGDYSSPFLFDYNDDGTPDLFSGSRNGVIYYYSNNGTNSAPIWDLVTDKFLTISTGGNSVPVFYDVDNDSDYDLLLGNIKGGLYLYDNQIISDIKEVDQQRFSQSTICAYPNPFNPFTNLKIEMERTSKIQLDIYNILGERILNLFSGDLSAGSYSFIWNGKNGSDISVPSGIYFAVLTESNNILTKKLLLIK